MKAVIAEYTEKAFAEYERYQKFAENKVEIYSIMRRETLLNSENEVEKIQRDVLLIL